MAEAYGLRVFVIIIHALGGEAHHEANTWRRGHDIRILAAGPLANIGLCVICLGAAAALRVAVSAAGAETIFYNGPPGIYADLWPPLRALQWLGWANLVLAVINMLPAFPLDGGRILALLIERRWNNWHSLVWVGLCGCVLACLSSVVFLVSLLGGMPIWSPPNFKPNWEAVQKGWHLRPLTRRR